MASSGGLLTYDRGAPSALERPSTQFIGELVDDANAVPLQNADASAMCAAGSDQRASFGLSQGLLVPGIKHLMHNTQKDMLDKLIQSTWFSEARSLIKLSGHVSCNVYYTVYFSSIAVSYEPFL